MVWGYTELREQTRPIPKSTHPEPTVVPAQKLSTPSTHDSLPARFRQEPHPSHPPCLLRRRLTLYPDATATAVGLGICVILIVAVPTPLKCAEEALLWYDPVN